MLAICDTTNPQTASRSQRFLPTLIIEQVLPWQCPQGPTPVLSAGVRRQTKALWVQNSEHGNEHLLPQRTYESALCVCVWEHVCTSSVYLWIVGRVEEATEKFPLGFCVFWKGHYFILFLAIETHQSHGHVSRWCTGVLQVLSADAWGEPTSSGPALPST